MYVPVTFAGLQRMEQEYDANCYIDEVGKRYSVFYIVGCVASAFAGILAYGVSIFYDFYAKNTLAVHNSNAFVAYATQWPRGPDWVALDFHH